MPRRSLLLLQLTARRPVAIADLLLGFVLFWPAGGRVAAAQVNSLRGVDERMAQMLKDWMVPGAAVGVVQDGSVIFAKGYGVREAGKAAPVDERTLFEI